jgi:hypothetical protein
MPPISMFACSSSFTEARESGPRRRRDGVEGHKAADISSAPFQSGDFLAEASIALRPFHARRFWAASSSTSALAPAIVSRLASAAFVPPDLQGFKKRPVTRAIRYPASRHTPAYSTFQTVRNVPARNRRWECSADFGKRKTGIGISPRYPTMSR